MRFTRPIAPILSLFATLLLAGIAQAEDWPTYLHDSARSSVTSEALPLPLHLQWTYQPMQAPRPAWPEPAKQDFWHELRNLKPVVVYDRAFHTVVADGLLYFGSSADDSVTCLDAATGETRWRFTTGGPVRLAPAVANGKLYFGSDDGWAYCLDAKTGDLVWRHRPVERERCIPGNGRVISDVPVRAGMVVDGETVCYFAGLFPSQAVYRCVVHAETGETIECEKVADISPQGYVAASPSRLFVPTGRTNPAIFERASGKYLGQLGGGGGAYAVVVEDTVASGPSRRTGDTLQFSDPVTRESVATCEGLRMVVRGSMAYIHSHTELKALDRLEFIARAKEWNKKNQEKEALEKQLEAAKAERDRNEKARIEGLLDGVQQEMDALRTAMEAAYRWKVPSENPYTLTLANETLFVGSENEVRAYSVSNGTLLWTANVAGRAYGLSIANQKLYVSTNDGAIHCFGPEAVAEPRTIETTPSPNPFPDNTKNKECWRTAKNILKWTDRRKGYCIVLGAGEGRLAYALAANSELQVIGIEPDAAKVTRGREALTRTGLYGTRITLRQGDDGRLPFTTYMANLVVSSPTEMQVLPQNEVQRLLRPWGGTLCIGPLGEGGPETSPFSAILQKAHAQGTFGEGDQTWQVFRRGALEDTGEWTQLYANPNHTASSSEPFKGPVKIQWFGEPGPRDIIDRHHRPMSSLFKAGRLFVPGDNLVMAVDPYNGTPLWTLEVPESRRVGALKNSGHMLVTEDLLYIAREDECWAVDVEMGEGASTLKAPQIDDETHDWGYLNQTGELLFGTGQRAGASFDVLAKATVNMLEGDHRPMVISRYAFAIDRHTGEEQWRYQNGAIMNDAICVADSMLCFVESRNENTVNDDNGRTSLRRFCKSDTYLTALDTVTGEKRYEQPVTLPYHHIMYLNSLSGVLVLSGSYNEEDKVFYGLYAFETETGTPLWEQRFRARDVRCTDFAGQGGSHGEQWQHPVLVNGTVYSRPHAFDLATGEQKDYTVFRGGHGCGGLTGSQHYLYGRGSNPRMYPLETKETEGIRLTHVSRPGCWLNIIPAGGLILIPESSSGCTCAYPLQTSFAFIPKTAAEIP